MDFALFPKNVSLNHLHMVDGIVWRKVANLAEPWQRVGPDPDARGLPGIQGLSAYEQAGGDPVWGSLNAWLASLKSSVPGPKGSDSTVPGPKGSDAVISGIVETPVRTLNTVFQPSADKVTSVYYTVDLAVGISISVPNQACGVQLLCDATNPPTTVRDEKNFTLAGALTLNLNVSQTQRETLAFIVPKGWYVKLSKTGAGTVQLVRQNEVMF